MKAAVQKAVNGAPRYVPPGKRERIELPSHFDLVPIADLASTEPAAPGYVLEGLVPAGHVTLLGAHGGTAKTTFGLMLCVCTALGRPLFGFPTRRGIAVFFSGEESAGLLRYRLRQICRGMGVQIEDLAARLHILDATGHDPTLFAEVTLAGRREGRTTPAYEALREFLQAHDAGLLVVDNASDTFDASEIERGRVRGFMRALAQLAQQTDAGLLLLAHVDKGTSRQERTGTEGYSGSTAWNNSARSRLFMRRDSDGTLVLEHQKHNLGKLREPLRLTWPEGGILQAEETFGAVVQGIADRGHERALLRLIAEFSARREHVSTAVTSRTHAGRILRKEPSFPHQLKDPEVFDLLRKAERAGYLRRVEMRGGNRHARECWELTQAGAAFADVPAPTAPTAPTSEVDAVSAPDAGVSALTALTSQGGTGGARAQK